MSIINAILAGAGGGFEYETGSFTPTYNISSKDITFSKTYNKPPAIMICFDSTAASTTVTDRVTSWAFMDIEQIAGEKVSVVFGPGLRAGVVLQTVPTSGTPNQSAARYLSYGAGDTTQTSASSATRGFATESGGKIISISSYFYLAANRKYTWIAIWLPDSWTPPA